MNRTRRLVIACFAILGIFTLVDGAVAAPKAKHHHQNGKQLLGEKIKHNGNHVINKKGDHTVSVDVKNGKIAAFHVKHAKKGELPVKKYKTEKKMARADGLQYASYLLAQAQSLGTVYIGYAYIDEYGDEEIYWYPYEMILDGDTGAVEYIPVY